MKLGLFSFLFIFSIHLFPANVLCNPSVPQVGSRFGSVDYCVAVLKELEPKLPKWLVAWLSQPGDIPLTPILFADVLFSPSSRHSDGLKDDKVVEILRARPELREYAVATSASGSGYRFERDSFEELKESEPLYTYQEATIQKAYWRSFADTVGGRAIVIHLPTYLKKYSKAPFVDLTSDLLPRQKALEGSKAYVSEFRRLKYRSVTLNSRTRIQGDPYDSVEITLLDGTKIRAKASEAGGDNPDPIFYDWHSSP